MILYTVQRWHTSRVPLRIPNIWIRLICEMTSSLTLGIPPAVPVLAAGAPLTEWRWRRVAGIYYKTKIEGRREGAFLAVSHTRIEAFRIKGEIRSTYISRDPRTSRSYIFAKKEFHARLSPHPEFAFEGFEAAKTIHVEIFFRCWSYTVP